MKHFLLILFALLWANQAFALVVSQDTLWSGEQFFTEDIRVLPGVTLTIEPGTKLHFDGSHLEVSGRLVADGAEFSGASWKGLRLKGAAAKTRISDCVIKGASVGVFVQGGSPILERLTLKDNKIGIEIRGKASGKVVKSLFLGNKKVGLFIKDNSTTAVVDCRFEKNLRYGAYLYRTQPESFQGNAFVDNDVGLMIAYHGTDPEVVSNRFAQNNVAIQVDRAARPVIRDNLLFNNQTGCYVYRRSDPLLTGNRFETNSVGVLVAYSSYPEIKGNDFIGNDMAIKLEFQSSLWELTHGADARAEETTARSAFAGQGMRSVTEDDRRAKHLDGRVNAAHNWWGEDGTLEMARIGSHGNPSFIHDGRDQATFVDAGEEFPLDKVSHAPWSELPLTELKR